MTLCPLRLSTTFNSCSRLRWHVDDDTDTDTDIIMAFMENIAVYAAVPALIWSSAVYLVQSVGILML